ncbi:hypothetical protein ACQCN2_10570 [Brevibacillus ginsengisoli]|uniref:hypothetical protein n=1 Tax=Brevibacillus ginsengisoli TaxID=363854 RepID=UPI003CEA9189
MMNKKAIVNWGVRIASVAFVVSVVGTLAGQAPSSDKKSASNSNDQPAKQYVFADNPSDNQAKELPKIVRRTYEHWENEDHDHEHEKKHDDDDDDHWEEDQQEPQLQSAHNANGFIELAPSYNAPTDTRTRAS